MLGEKVCRVCGKRFYGANEGWVYRKGIDYMCSWTCFNLCPDKKGRRGNRIGLTARDERNAAIYADHKSGMSFQDIAEKYKMTVNWVRTVINRIREQQAEETQDES